MRIYRYRRVGSSSEDVPVEIRPHLSNPRVGISLEGSAVIDLPSAWTAMPGRNQDADRPGLWSVASFIEAGPSFWSMVEEAAQASLANPDHHVRLESADIEVLCPLDRMASLRDFLAFEDHVKRGAERRNSKVPEYWYEAPVYYKGNHRALIGPNDECPWPSYTERLDFELELAMIVGRRGRDITSEGADRHVFGFTILNDFSARDIQMREVTAWLGPAKGKDFANSLGPCIITADEVGSEPDLEMICRVNGEEWGRSRSSNAHWRWRDMISHVSASEDIYPGDVYGSGTPGGCCGLDLGRELAPGDIVELEIEKIGVLRNTIGSPL